MFKAFTKKKKKKGSCALGQRGPQCTAEAVQPNRTGACARTSGF